MSMEHKAFAFDWPRFARGLRPILVRALAADDPAPLEAYIDRHRGQLTDPYLGEPLDPDWRDRLENGDVQELGDFALTRYYRPMRDRGLGHAWMTLSDELPAPAAAALLGVSIGDDGALFDPGRMGSYFQTPARVRRSLAALRGVRRPELRGFRRLLERCTADRLGVYVTF
jgi:hypothetical protein